MLCVEGKRIDDPQRPWVIAEISGNHAQDYETACALVRAAAEAGADACKVQLLTPELICADLPIPLGYDAQHDAWCHRLGVTRLRQLFELGGLPRAWCVPLKRLAESLGLTWFATPFSVEEARFLVEEVGVEVVKVASGDLTFTPMLAYLASTGLPLIVSTGCATLDECLHACHEVLEAAWLDERLAVLHCVSSYPATPTMMNLRCMATLAYRLDVPVGLSDHTLSTDRIPAVAVATGVCSIYEKHLVLKRSSGSIDAPHSLEPHEFQRMVQVIRETPLILGDGVKAPHASEGHDRLWGRRSPVDNLRPTEEARQGRWA